MFSKKDLIFQIPDPIDWDGKFGKNVLVIWEQDGTQSGTKDFLEKMLSAVQVNLELDCCYKAFEKGATCAITPVIKQKQPNQVLVFGIEPAKLGLHFEQYLYHPLFFYQTWFLFADNLGKLEPDRGLKTQLWNNMKQIFTLENK